MKNKWVPVVLSVFLLAFPLAVWLFQEKPSPLPILGTLPTHYVFKDHDAKDFSIDTMKGKIWVANFIFTSCPDVCPGLTNAMKLMDAQHGGTWKDDVAYASFSVDPSTDTPQVLSAYRARFGITNPHWKFLTGDMKLMEEAVTQSFRVAMGREAKEGGNLFEITHGNYFVLVDRKLRVRGYFDAIQGGQEPIEKAVESLRQEG